MPFVPPPPPQTHVADVAEVRRESRLAVGHRVAAGFLLFAEPRCAPLEAIKPCGQLDAAAAGARVGRIHQGPVHAAEWDRDPARLRFGAGGCRRCALPQQVCGAGLLRVQQIERTGFVIDHGDIASLIRFVYVQVGQAFGGQGAGDAVNVHREDVAFHSAFVQGLPRIAAALDVEPPQRPFARAEQGAGAAGRVPEVELRDLFGAAIGEALGRECREEFGDGRLRIVRGALFTVDDQELPELACEVVDVFRVQAIDPHAQLGEAPENRSDLDIDPRRGQRRDRQVHDRLVVHEFDRLPGVEERDGS